MSPHQVTREFEAALCRYTGAKYAVTTTSCTQAILMALAWHARRLRCAAIERDQQADLMVTLPKRTYVGVPASVLNAGCRVKFEDIRWHGEYQLSPLPVWDCARRFTSGMFKGTIRRLTTLDCGRYITQTEEPVDHSGHMLCVSFHWSKILGLSQGGAILHDNDEADAWLRRARFDGRTEGADPKTDQVQYPSWHAYLSPEVAAHGLMKLSLLPPNNDDLPNSDYPDLSTMEAFR